MWHVVFLRVQYGAAQLKCYMCPPFSDIHEWQSRRGWVVVDSWCCCCTRRGTRLSLSASLILMHAKGQRRGYQFVQVAAAGHCDFTATVFPPLSSPPSSLSSARALLSRLPPPLPSPLARRHCGVREREAEVKRRGGREIQTETERQPKAKEREREREGPQKKKGKGRGSVPGVLVALLCSARFPSSFLALFLAHELDDPGVHPSDACAVLLSSSSTRDASLRTGGASFLL